MRAAVRNRGIGIHERIKPRQLLGERDDEVENDEEQIGTSLEEILLDAKQLLVVLEYLCAALLLSMMASYSSFGICKVFTMSSLSFNVKIVSGPLEISKCSSERLPI